MNDYFLLDSDYKDFPEKGKLKFLTVYGEQHTFIALAVFLLIAYGFMLYIFLFVGFPREYSYLVKGLRAQATVIEPCLSPQNTYIYLFEAKDIEGKIHQYKGTVYPDKYSPCLKVGDTITVEYLADQPENSSRKISESSLNISGLCALAFCLIFVLFAIHIALKDIHAFLQARVKYPLLKQATTIFEAKIVAVKDSKKDKIHGRIRGDYCIEVEYEFILNKRLFTGKQLHKRNDLQGKPLPTPGTAVRVLYADEDTYVML